MYIQKTTIQEFLRTLNATWMMFKDHWWLDMHSMNVNADVSKTVEHILLQTNRHAIDKHAIGSQVLSYLKSIFTCTRHNFQWMKHQLSKILRKITTNF